MDNIDLQLLSNNSIDDRVHFLMDLLHCNGRMFISRYDALGNLVETNYTNMIFDTVLRSTEYLDQALNHAKTSDYPLIITTVLGMMWAVVNSKDDNGQLNYLYTLGPIFTTSLTEDTFEQIYKNRKIRERWKKTFIDYLTSVPVITATEFFKYTLMLHYSVNNIYLKPSDLVFSSFSNQAPLSSGESRINYAEFWARESAMLEMVKNGDIYYKSKIPSASNILQKINPHSDKDVQGVTLYAISFVTLCIRASIDGGISPDSAYLRGNIYLKNITSSKSYAEILSITQSVFEDFVFLVHNHKDKPDYSPAIISCTEYINAHPDEPLDIDYLAERLNYTKYYLSRKFHAEVGMTVNTYIKKARIEKACYLLVTTKMSIQDISDHLRFGNRNFFTKVFKEQTGTNPAAFRSEHTHL